MVEASFKPEVKVGPVCTDFEDGIGFGVNFQVDD